MVLLFILLGALTLGYQIKVKLVDDKAINKVLLVLVALILFVMGYEFGIEARDLLSELVLIAKIVVVFGVFIFIANFMAISLIFKTQNQNLRDDSHNKVSANFIELILSSSKYILMIASGAVLGSILNYKIELFEIIINVLLVFLLFIVGYQLRSNNIPLRQVFFNKLGLGIAFVVVFSSLLAGILAGVCLGIPISTSLAMSSGFGWYTLSSILTGSLINENYGAAVFFIDFTREVVAIILLPSIGRIFPLSMIGYCGATSLDFSLPIIKQNLDTRTIIVAISSGMILSILVPILIPFFANM
ncbi:MAG: LysO family transporter [Burkholderiales bacterium]|nr:LysO family transporter [Burkholderiales bacterium]